MNKISEKLLKAISTQGTGNPWVENMFKCDKPKFEEMYPKIKDDWECDFTEELSFARLDPAGPDKDYTATQMLEIGGSRGGGKTEIMAQRVWEETRMVEYISDFNSSQNKELQKKLGEIFSKAMAAESLKVLTSGGSVNYKPNQDSIYYGGAAGGGCTQSNHPESQMFVDMGKGSGFA